MISEVNSKNISLEILGSSEPVVIRQLVSNWPAVKYGRISDSASVDYLKSYYNGTPTVVCKIPPENNGRMFYNDSYTELNYESYKGYIDETMDAILAGLDCRGSPAYYIASNVINTHFPGFSDENGLVIPRDKHPEALNERVSIWIGGETTATCHFDALENIACCVAGKRRFTLFPPNQIGNLYPGPLDPTPGGQVISLVDFKNPDFDKFPRFGNALLAAQVVDLEPGDALYIPTMWWHHVESLASYNVLVNYWWEDTPDFLTSGMNSLYFAMLGIRDKSSREREAWKHIFEYYIFSGSEMSNAHLPPESRGFLRTLDRLAARKLRAMLSNKLNR
ncbi:cupin-like domain-containing protein [Gilvimarinus algae]|uniref:Cupin-like domain-containing protein n=1 Tax=Gilvimarinus algae TaxID=3058037 RepID=A0ABT8T9W6_9GAMM|nr:cupin-like domain-containing protein [Gilvimarinus sp. SDUM040014]MDO3380917.1 cupin-like domain-containing protein [Gilvimarinus sp. SDUM040014]